VHTGTGLWRSHRRKAKNLASMIEALRAHPPEPKPVERHTQAEASDEATDIKAAATTSEARIRPISSSSLTQQSFCNAGILAILCGHADRVRKRWPFTNWKRLFATLQPFLGGRGLHEEFGSGLVLRGRRGKPVDR
jgi:hypothetical protein